MKSFIKTTTLVFLLFICSVKQVKSEETGLPDLIIKEITYKSITLENRFHDVVFVTEFTVHIKNIGTMIYIGELFISNTKSMSDIEMGHYSSGRRVSPKSTIKPNEMIEVKALDDIDKDVPIMRFLVQSEGESNISNNTYDLIIKE